jgi:CHAD domain-containing protein
VKHHDVVARRCRAKLLGLMRGAAKRITDERIPIEKRVHDVRRVAKEGRALLKLTSPLFAEESRKQRTALRDLRRRFGAARDSRVALSLIADRQKTEKANDPALHRARHELERRCHAEEATLTPDKLARTAAQFAAIAHSIEQWSINPESDIEILARAAKCYKQARRLMPETEEPSFEELHAFRSAVIDHHHQMSLLAKCDGQRANRRVEQLQHLRASLGDCLDLSGLETHVNDDENLSAHRSKDHVKYRKHACLREALQVAHTLFQEKPGSFALHLN